MVPTVVQNISGIHVHVLSMPSNRGTAISPSGRVGLLDLFPWLFRLKCQESGFKDDADRTRGRVDCTRLVGIGHMFVDF